MHIILTCVFCLFALPALAMGERRSEPDPACFVSETLRVEIGGERFAFPRKMVHSMRGELVKNKKGEKYDGSATGSEACQKLGDIWPLQFIMLNLYPMPCDTRNECWVRTIFANLENLSNYNSRLKNWSGLNKIYPRDIETLLAECVPPKKPWNDTHAKTWSHCNYVFEHNKLKLRIKFKGGIYPPEQIEQTKLLVLEEIRKHSISH